MVDVRARSRQPLGILSEIHLNRKPTHTSISTSQSKLQCTTAPYHGATDRGPSAAPILKRRGDQSESKDENGKIPRSTVFIPSGHARLPKIERRENPELSANSLQSKAKHG